VKQALLMMVLGAAAPLGLAGPVVSVSSERFSDPLPLGALLANELAQAQPRGEHNLVYLRDEVRLGAAWSGGTLSVIARQSATLVANAGAVSVISDVSTPGGPASSYDQAVQLRFSGFAGVGLAFDTQGSWPGGRWSWQAGAQVLSLRRLMARDLAGRASYDAATRIYSFDARSSYANDHLSFYAERPFADAGWGALLSGGVTWQATDQAQLSLKVQDLGRLQWSGLPQEAMALSTNTSQVDAQGYLVYRPLVQGRNVQSRYTASATATWTADAQWAVTPSATAVVTVRRMDGFKPWLPSTGVRWGGSSWQGSVGWLWHERAMSVGAACGHWRIDLAADRLDALAHTRMASVRWSRPID
jgi:hypothetical protein